jgi:hypothetical protein
MPKWRSLELLNGQWYQETKQGHLLVKIGNTELHLDQLPYPTTNCECGHLLAAHWSNGTCMLKNSSENCPCLWPMIDVQDLFPEPTVLHTLTKIEGDWDL